MADPPAGRTPHRPGPDRIGEPEHVIGNRAIDGASPTVAAEAAVIHTRPAGRIGGRFGSLAGEIGVLTGAKGLRRAGNGADQELARGARAMLHDA